MKVTIPTQEFHLPQEGIPSGNDVTHGVIRKSLIKRISYLMLYPLGLQGLQGFPVILVFNVLPMSK